MVAGFSPKQKFASDGESAALLPSISVPSYPAQDKNTIIGVVPPVAYTKVNASIPPVPDAGSSAQKSIAPMGAQALPKTAQAFSREDPTMNMTHRPLVQDLVKQAMSNAAQRAKIADEGARQMKLAEEKCGECGKEPCECKKDKKASVSGEIGTDFVLKLAAAIEFAAPQVVDMAKKAAPNMPPPHFSEKQQEGPEGVSASNQGGTPPGPGGQGKGHMQPPTNPGTQKAMPQEHGATQLENTMNQPVPGEQTTAMSGGKGKTASDALFAKNLGALAKVGFAVTQKGHEYDAAVNEMKARHGAELQALHDHFSGGRFGLTDEGRRHIADQGGAQPSGAVERLVNLIRFGGTGMDNDAMVRHHEYTARKHQEGSNAWNPFGGMLTPSKHEVGGDRRGMGAYKSKAPEMPKEGSALVDNFLTHIKQAEDAINPASISAGPAVPPDTSASGESGGAPVAGMPQGPRGLVGSNESAINYKKQTAYAPRKSELAQYFNEPALSSATDSTLNQAFAHTGEAGVKISAAQLLKSASARALLAKLAGEEKEKDNTESRFAPGHSIRQYNHYSDHMNDLIHRSGGSMDVKTHNKHTQEYNKKFKTNFQLFPEERAPSKTA